MTREDRKAAVQEAKADLFQTRRTAIEDQLNSQMEHDVRTKGWTEIPVTFPHIDVPIILEYLDQRGWLDRITFAIIPSENPPGTWEALLTSVALTITKNITKVAPGVPLETVEMDLEAPGMEPALPESTEITRACRFENNPKRCHQCDLFKVPVTNQDGEPDGCAPLGEKDGSAPVCRAFIQTTPTAAVTVLYREESG